MAVVTWASALLPWLVAVALVVHARRQAQTRRMP